ncbi:MAG: excinuclease ABC subunit UvrC [Pseudomonadota bacterium]|nr:excinuclease ABC subunit UvrC [Pseudomonadota bacterium]QKK04333.1 MAG: excinuclease ABC subunit UvrC [Pseudomonadota bacterium]
MTKTREAVPPSLAEGIKIIKEFAAGLPLDPGVYRMLDKNGEALYVGKAKELKKRVQSYTRARQLTVRLARMVAETVRMEFTVTATEAEALLLETNLIKKLKPRYNILMRDDKSFPYIAITSDHDYPRVLKHRGAKRKNRDYFGPFAGAGDVNRTLALLQKAFMLRNCTDHDFATRSRPCLQYQIKRCTAPCVGYVSKEDYAAQVKMAENFLTGKSAEIQKDFAAKMQQESDAMNFEKAAQYRDRIRALSAVQSRQGFHAAGLQDADIIVIHQQEGRSCILSFFYRSGQYYGNHAFYPRHDVDAEDADVMTAFLLQFYESHPAPPEIYLNVKPREKNLIAQALSLQEEKKVAILVPQRGRKREMIEQAALQAEKQCRDYVSGLATQKQLLKKLAKILGLAAAPTRIEVYDNSHISGTNAVGAMIVAGEEGFQKQFYRKFNIAQGSLTPGDDYAMMREVLRRRFARVQKDDPDKSKNLWPDLVILDGGKGQLSTGLAIFEELGIADVPIVAVAKGVERNAGREKIFLPGKAAPLSLPEGDAVLYFIQRIRDEAHRFAIGAHRTRRKNAAHKTPLDDIDGIGAKRKKALLKHFGSARAVSEAGIADIATVEGISHEMARKIYEYFR